MSPAPAADDLAGLFAPRSLALAAIRVAVLSALLALGLALLALLSEAQRGPDRKLQVAETAWEPAVAVGFACVPPVAFLTLFGECLLPLLARTRLRPATLLLVGSGLAAAAGAWAAWTILGLGEDEVRPKRFALAGAAGLLFLLVGALHVALWLAAHQPRADLREMPFAWHLTVAGLAALTLGGRWGWAALDPKLRAAAHRHAERWAAPAAPPLPPLDARDEAPPL